MSNSLFGTDGIRAKAFEYPLVPSVLERLGGVFAAIAPSERGRLVLFARDTRVIGVAILKHLLKGFQRAGFQTLDLGVLPTPSLAFLVPQWNAVLGCMISASHNPPEFNGVKFFGPSGGKMPRVWEEKAEAILASSHSGEGRNPGLDPGFHRGDRKTKDMTREAYQSYLDFLRSSVPADMDFRGLRIAVDGGEGAASEVLPEMLRTLGAKVEAVSCGSDGRRINVNCGALHPERLGSVVRRSRCDIGFALDGDADRLMVVDETGKVFAGETLMAAVALDRRASGLAGSSALVTTLVSNFALKNYLESKGMPVFETPVGDRWVLEELQRQRLGFGGENSGHFIWTHILPSADACLGALQILQMIKRKGSKASGAIFRFPLYPQISRQVHVAHKLPLEGLRRFQAALGSVKKALAKRGRVLVRYSGTEPVLRILLEGSAGRSRLQALCGQLESAFLQDIKR